MPVSIDFTLRFVKLIPMKKNSLPAVRKGRPPRQTAESHAAIMDAVYALLQKEVRPRLDHGRGRQAGQGRQTHPV